MPTTANVQLRTATAADAELLGNLLELYIHDLSVFFPQVQLGPDGRFGYAALPLYVAGASDRWAWLIEYQGRVVGFALAQRGSPATDDPSVLDVAEFFVLRRFRDQGVGCAAAHAMWKLLPGTWTVRVSPRHARALAFWQATIASHLERPLPPIERSIAGKPWLVFQFGA